METAHPDLSALAAAHGAPLPVHPIAPGRRREAAPMAALSRTDYRLSPSMRRRLSPRSRAKHRRRLIICAAVAFLAAIAAPSIAARLAITWQEISQ